MTLEEFAQVFGTLAIQLRQTDADEATIRSYFSVLQDLEIELVRMAAAEFAKSAEWFPKTAEWRQAVAKVETQRAEALRARLRRLSAPICRACDDTGWMLTGEPLRASACDCRRLRRLEILGRRPFPALPSGADEADATVSRGTPRL